MSRIFSAVARRQGTLPRAARLADFNGDGLQDFYLEQALNEDGSLNPRIWLSAPSGELTLVVETPQAPGAPLGLTYQVSAGTVGFSWQAPAGVVDGYVVEAGSQPGLTNLATLPVGNTTSFTVAGVPPGTYYVRVRAFNSAGQGPPSSEATVIVP